MAQSNGAMQIANTLAAIKAAKGVAYDIAMDQDFNQQIRELFNTHNRMMGDLVSLTCDFTTDRTEQISTTHSLTMQKLGELGRSYANNNNDFGTVGYPLEKFGSALSYSAETLKIMQPQELAKQLMAILTADRKNILLQIKNAIFNSINYTFYDFLIDNVQLPVKRLQNNDTSTSVPINPNTGDVIASSHNHYLGYSTYTYAAFDGLIATVTEHQSEADVKIYTAYADYANAIGVTGFQKILPVTTIAGISSDHADQSFVLDHRNPYDRLIGFYNGHEVWTKPFVPTNYIAAQVFGADVEKPLRIRVRGNGKNTIGGTPMSIFAGGNVDVSNGSAGDLDLVYENPQYPLICKEYHRQFGVGVYNRCNMAVAYIGDTSYVAASLS